MKRLPSDKGNRVRPSHCCIACAATRLNKPCRLLFIITTSMIGTIGWCRMHITIRTWTEKVTRMHITSKGWRSAARIHITLRTWTEKVNSWTFFFTFVLIIYNATFVNVTIFLCPYFSRDMKRRCILRARAGSFWKTYSYKTMQTD